MRRELVFLLGLLVLFFVLSPSDFYTNLGSRILIACLLAFSLNMLLGHAGLMSLTQSAIGGIAAYCIAWSTAMHGFGHLAAVLIAIIVSVLVSAAYGAVALRVQGIGFLMITLALGQITWGLAQRWTEVTGGENGITGLTRPMPFGVSIETANSFYLFTAAVFFVVFCALRLFSGSCFGATVRGTCDQPRRMSALGYNVWLIRWITFIAAGFLASIAGILDVYYNKFATPNLMSLTETAAILLMVIAGGSSVLLGPLCGAALVLVLTQVASSYTEHWVGLLGLLFLLIVLFMPDGILPFTSRVAKALRCRIGSKQNVDKVAPISASAP